MSERNPNFFQDILTNAAQITLTGGTEIMSALPLLVRNARFKIPLGSSIQLEDYITKQALDSYSGLTLQQIAENVAKQYELTRDEVDEFAFQSYLKWEAGEYDRFVSLSGILRNIF